MDDFEKRRIFVEIDKIISECNSKFPVPFKQSKFKKLYEELKKQEGIEDFEDKNI
jgi:hypothetical protein